MDDFTAPAEIAAPIDAPEVQAEGSLDGLTQGQALYKLMVDGQEEEVDIETLKKAYSHGKGADKRMTEAGRTKADALRVLDLLRADPIAALKELQGDSFNEKEFVTKRLAALMDDEMMSPEERTARQEADELKAYRAEKQKAKEEMEQKSLTAAMELESNNLYSEFSSAFQEAGLPQTLEANKRLATMMLEALENGQNIPARTLAKQVKQEMQAELIALLKGSDDDTFEQLLGSDLLTRSQKLSLKKVKSPGERQAPTGIKREPTSSPQATAKRTSSDFLRSQGLL